MSSSSRRPRPSLGAAVLAVALLAGWPSAWAQEAAADGDGTVATSPTAPADETPPAPPGQPAATTGGDETPPLIDAPPPPGREETPPEPEPIRPPTRPAQRKQAFISALEPGSIVKSGPDRSVIARGKLQMVIPDDNLILYCTAVDYEGETTGLAILTGDLRIETGEIVQEVRQIRTAAGTEEFRVSRIPRPENVLTGDIAYVFTKEKRAVVDGNVVIVHTPKSEAPAGVRGVERAQYDVSTVYCDRLTYWYRQGDRKAVAKPRLPNTRIRWEQATRRGTAGDAIFYDFEPGQSETGDVLDLRGGVIAEDDDGQRVEADVCRVYLDLETTQWHNIHQLIVNIDEEPSPAEPAGPPLVPGGATEPEPATAPDAPTEPEPATAPDTPTEPGPPAPPVEPPPPAP